MRAGAESRSDGVVRRAAALYNENMISLTVRSPSAMSSLAGLVIAALVVAATSIAQTPEPVTRASGNPGVRSNPYPAPLFWSVYEYHFVREQAGVQDNYIPESVLLANIDWVDENLKDLGYGMICMDGWGDVSQVDQNGYRTSHSVHWQHDYAWWAAELESRGMTLGIYDNPLWIHMNAVAAGATIVGTDIPVESLVDYDEDALWFTWVQVDRPGAEEYVKGCVKHYADMGVEYLRVDFLSWYETGYDRNLGMVGPSRPPEQYETALRWMREACDENGVYLSLVMPNLFDEARVERRYGHSVRVNEDCAEGGWFRFSDKDRGHRYPTWSQYASALDGYAYWSHIAGRDSIDLDGDFIRLNTFASDTEKRTVVSAHIMAGGPIMIADEYDTIGDDLPLYQNAELLALSQERFVAQPLTNDPTDEQSQVWTGQTTCGDPVVGLFNREDSVRTRNVDFADLGLAGNVSVRDLWQHACLGSMQSLSVELPPHGCLIARLSAAPCPCDEQTIAFGPIEDKVYGCADFAPDASATSGLPVSFEVALGPAETVDGKIHLTGGNGTVYVTASQAGNDSICAALPRVQSFEVTGGHQDRMYVAGTFTGWSPNIPMTLVNDIWVAEDVEIGAGYQEMKFANTSDWSGDDWGNATGLAGIAQLATGGQPNISFTMPASGTYEIRFDDIHLAYTIGNGTGTDGDADGASSWRVELDQNVPNPFGASTTLRFRLPRESIARITVYDAGGRLVRVLGEGTYGEGEHEITWRGLDAAGTRVAPGIYFCRLTSGNARLTRKVVLLE
jgi:hypothetical protein